MKTKVKLILKSGDGGDGWVSFRKEKFIPRGGPDGGDGGDGGDVIIKPDNNMWDLSNYEDSGFISAGDGADGGKSQKNGKRGTNAVLNVPYNCEVTLEDSSVLSIKDEIVLVKGGEKGKGNKAFKSSINQEPLLAEAGQRGLKVELELKTQTFPTVGIIGNSNSGKSFILNKITNLGAKEADYLYTTTSPVIGNLKTDIENIKIVEIPDFINFKKADEYKFFLNEFNVLLVTIEYSDRFNHIYNQIKQYINKLVHSSCNIIFIITKCTEPIPINQININEENIFQVVDGTIDIHALKNMIVRFNKSPKKGKGGKSEDIFVHKPKIINITKKFEYDARRNIVVILDNKLIRIARGSNLQKPEAQLQFHNILNKTGYLKAFEKSGITKGAIIKFEDVEMEFK